MFENLCTFILFYGLIKYDIPHIIYDKVKDTASRLPGLNQLVSLKYDNTCMKIYAGISLVCSMLWIDFLQYMNNSVKQIAKGTYEIKYVINGKTYKSIVMKRLGPSPFLQVIDENTDDVTSEVSVYTDYEAVELKPALLGYKTLTFECSNGQEITLQEHDEIKLH